MTENHIKLMISENVVNIQYFALCMLDYASCSESSGVALLKWITVIINKIILSAQVSLTLHMLI